MKLLLFFKKFWLLAVAASLLILGRGSVSDDPSYAVDPRNPAFASLKRYVESHPPVVGTNEFEGYSIAIADDPQKIVRLSKCCRDPNLEKWMKAKALSPDSGQALAELDFNRGMVMIEQGQRRFIR